MAKEHYIPVRKTKSYDLLAEMLKGREFDLIDAVRLLNVQSINARVSELRRMGWPIISDTKPHPSLPGEEMMVYRLDMHFRNWYWNDHKGKIDPNLYDADDGARKSFAAKLGKGSEELKADEPKKVVVRVRRANLEDAYAN